MNFLPKKDTFKSAFSIAWPAILESFFVAFVGLVDSFMVSSLGSNAVAAVGLTTQPKFLGLSLFFATNVAVSALVARRKGEQRRDSANNIALTAFIFVIFADIVISTLLTVFASPIMHLCGSEPEPHDDAVLYYQIIMGGMIFNCLQMIICAAQRGSGYTKITLRTHLASNIVNVIFNYLLIGGNFGFPALGIKGAALATVLGTVVACIMSFASVMNKDRFISIPYIIKEKIRPSLTAAKNLLRIGYSIFFEQILMRIGFMTTAIIAADCGTNAMAAHQVGMNIMGLSFSFGDGLQAAAVALIGQSLGAKEPQKAKEYGKTCQFMGFCISLCLAIIYFFGARPLYSLFFKEEVIIGYGVQIMQIIIITCIFQISQVIYTGCLRGAGDTLYTAVSSTINVTIIRSGVAYACCYLFNLGIAGVWLGILADQIGRLVMSYIRFKKGQWVKVKI